MISRPDPVRPDLARHDLVWLDPARLADIAVARDDERAPVADWIAADRPAIVRRSEILRGEGVPLGIPLPARHGRRRLSISVPPDAIARTGAMPRLADAMAVAPRDWAPGLRALAGILAAIPADLRVYGSLGWQCLTGETYLREGSDLDLLIVPRAALDPAAALEAFADLAAATAPRVDGEIILGHDRAVAWREFLTPCADLLVRSRTEIRLEPRASVLRALANLQIK